MDKLFGGISIIVGIGLVAAASVGVSEEVAVDQVILPTIAQPVITATTQSAWLADDRNSFGDVLGEFIHESTPTHLLALSHIEVVNQFPVQPVINNGSPTLVDTYNFGLYVLHDSNQFRLVKKQEAITEKQLIEQTLHVLRVNPEVVAPYAILLTNQFDFGEHLATFKPSADDPSKVIANMPVRSRGAVNVDDKLLALNRTLPDHSFQAVLVHELGHIVQQLLSNEEFASYQQLRNIPVIDPTVISVLPWSHDPREDFAEVFRVVFDSQLPSQISDIRTAYGPVTLEQRRWTLQLVGPKFQL
jgi:hypothetical protein